MGKGKSYNSVENLQLFLAYVCVMERIGWNENKPSGLWEAITTCFQSLMDSAFEKGEINFNPGRDRTSRGLRGQWRKIRRGAIQYIGIHERIAKNSPEGTTTEMHQRMAVLEYQEVTGKANSEFLECFHQILLHPRRNQVLQDDCGSMERMESTEYDDAAAEESLHDASTVLQAIRDSGNSQNIQMQKPSLVKRSSSAVTEADTGLVLTSLSQHFSETSENSTAAVNLAIPRPVKKVNEVKRGKIRKREYSFSGVAESLEKIVEAKHKKLEYLKEQHKSYMALQERQKQIQLFTSEDMPIELRRRYMSVMGTKILEEIEAEKSKQLSSVKL